MHDGPLNIVSEYLTKIVSATQAKTDAELLALYAAQRDDESFAVLVQRHGPMVLGVCRRALGHSADAEDAFQATFLALSRSAAKIGDCVPGWLYRVAMRTSRKALKRMPLLGGDSVDPADPFAEVEWRDVRRLLDEELERLPAKWRMPLVLCYLEGRTRDETATELGVSLRTLHRRLDKGRTRLNARLSRRGLAPALLGVAVLAPLELCAAVSPGLAGKTIRLVSGVKTPLSVQTLLSAHATFQGMTMKILVCGVLMVGGVLAVLGNRQRTDASPLVSPVEPPVLVRAPLQKPRHDDAQSRRIKEAQKRAVEFLKGQQKEDRDGQWSWESAGQKNVVMPGGASCLALLALLENGVKRDAAVVTRGLKFIRSLELKNTYVVALQTQALCKAHRKEDAERIQRNVRWLEDAASWKAGALLGWRYGGTPGGDGDNSNTRYALAGLYDAHLAGFEVRKVGFWQAVVDYYVRTQKPEGGWGYVTYAPKATNTMTTSALLGLTHAHLAIGKEDKASGAAINSGQVWLANEFGLENSQSIFYNLDVIAALGRANSERYVGEGDKKRDWYKEGCDWLLSNQGSHGEWSHRSAIDQNPIIATSFALRFLASRPADR